MCYIYWMLLSNMTMSLFTFIPSPHLSHPGQPRCAYQSLGIRVGLLVHNELGHLVVTTVGSDVQRRQVVVGDVVHRHVMLEQELDAVQMVPLSGHVER